MLVFLDEWLLCCILILDLLVLFCTLIFLAGTVVIMQRMVHLLAWHLWLSGVVLVVGFVWWFFKVSQELFSNFQLSSWC